MSEALPPGEQARRALLSRCEAYCARTGTAESALAVRLMNASNFITRLRTRTITLATLDRVHAELDRLEAQWAAEHTQGEPDGEDEEGSDAAPPAGHRDQGAAVY